MFVDRGLEEETAIRIDAFVKGLDRRALLFTAKAIREKLADLAREEKAGVSDGFVIGQRVYFRAPDGSEQSGVLLHLSKHLASIEDDAGRRWNVPPPFLISGQDEADDMRANPDAFGGFGFSGAGGLPKLSLVTVDIGDTDDGSPPQTGDVTTDGDAAPLSEFELARYAGILREWCDARVSVEQRGTLRILFSIDENQVLLSERKHGEGKVTDRPFARGVWEAGPAHWLVYWMRHDSKWQLYHAKPNVAELADLLRIIDGDTKGCFFS